MDKQAANATTPPTPPATTPSPSAARRDLPSTSSKNNSPPSSSASSEPSLRFPRPQGNRRLASWISASNPDVMHSVSLPDETGLSESTYELIVGTDTESVDGNYTESVAGSVGSLDLRRPDDVHSLDGTEYTYDGESVPGDVDGPARTDRSSEGSGHTEDDDPEDDDDDDDQDFCPQCNDRPGDFAHADEARSRCSLEYTQHSLGTPSINTPEASRLTERPPGSPRPGDKPASRLPFCRDLLTRLWRSTAPVWDSLTDTNSVALPGLLFTTAVSLLILMLYIPPAQNGASPLSTAASTPMASVAPLIASTAKPSGWPGAHPSPLGGMGLIALDDKSDDWLLGPKKQRISLTPKAHTNILVHVPADVKQNWLAKDCLAVSAVRQGRQVETTSSPVDEGILLSFSKKEAYGVVDLSLEATCRPKVQRLVKVYFNKGVMEEALEKTKSLAHDICGLVPAAAQEAERCLEGARRSLGAVSDSVGSSVLTASDKFLFSVTGALVALEQTVVDATRGARERYRLAYEGLDTASQRATDRATEKLRHVQNRLQLSLLHAQLSAKIWWLDATGRKQQHDEYQRKAKEFMAKKMAAAACGQGNDGKRAEESKPTATPHLSVKVRRIFRAAVERRLGALFQGNQHTTT
ncbi:hypothetical protein CDD80_6375 [Ophiocordyceps camponoti-rufipedis]|uniref:Uncharacterized protein n=1 Tax=Ophiocordyceps camponoti-rufipedis TaxID=2004952 RepID=A0A2C5YSC1_9HYPO|nr:hypothetical protein CDD80_6375 [Ophiocordyceps camponoti-rufipedis]